MGADERKEPRRALDLDARRALREFASLLPGLDLPGVACAVPFSYEAPDSYLPRSAIEIAVILVGVRPLGADALRTELRQRLESATETCRQRTGSYVWPHIVWEGELHDPDDEEAPREHRRIRRAVESGGWALSDRQSRSQDTPCAPHVRFAAASHAVRRGSQDDGFAVMQMPDGRGSVYAVADGVGARYNAGLFASMAAQQVLRCAYGVPLRNLVRQIGTELDAVNRTPQSVESVAHRGIGERGTGATTLLVARSTREALDVVWVGDSRAYLWTPDEGLTQLTRDQHDAYGTCCLGVHHEVIPDPLEESLPPMSDGARLLLCTDGGVRCSVRRSDSGRPVGDFGSAARRCKRDAVGSGCARARQRNRSGSRRRLLRVPKGTGDERDAYASWFGPDGRVMGAAPISTITGVESFESLGTLVHNVAFNKKLSGRPAVLVGCDAGTNLLRALRSMTERYGFEILWVNARDIPTPDALAKALGGNDGKEDVPHLLAARGEAAVAKSESRHGGVRSAGRQRTRTRPRRRASALESGGTGLENPGLGCFGRASGSPRNPSRHGCFILGAGAEGRGLAFASSRPCATLPRMRRRQG